MSLNSRLIITSLLHHSTSQRNKERITKCWIGWNKTEKKWMNYLDSELAFRNISAFRADLIIIISWSSWIPPHFFTKQTQTKNKKSKRIFFFFFWFFKWKFKGKLENRKIQEWGKMGWHYSIGRKQADNQLKRFPDQ